HELLRVVGGGIVAAHGLAIGPDRIVAALSGAGCGDRQQQHGTDRQAAHDIDSGRAKARLICQVAKGGSTACPAGRDRRKTLSCASISPHSVSATASTFFSAWSGRAHAPA